MYIPLYQPLHKYISSLSEDFTAKGSGNGFIVHILAYFWLLQGWGRAQAH